MRVSSPMDASVANDPGARVRAAYARLIQAELDLKRGLMDDRLAIELAVQELASRPVASASR